METSVTEMAYGYEQDFFVEDGILGRTESCVYTETQKQDGIPVSCRYLDIEGNVVKEETGSAFVCYTYMFN